MGDGYGCWRDSANKKVVFQTGRNKGSVDENLVYASREFMTRWLEISRVGLGQMEWCIPNS